MKISRQEDYAITFVAALLKARPPGRYVILASIARQYHLPLPFLRKIASTLKTAGVVSVKEGRNGGYRLSGSPKDLTLGKVLGAFSPQVFLTDCSSSDHAKICSLYDTCPSRLAWQGLTQKMTRDLYRIKFRQFIKQLPA